MAARTDSANIFQLERPLGRSFFCLKAKKLLVVSFWLVEYVILSVAKDLKVLTGLKN